MRKQKNQVKKLLLKGKSQKEIANKLSISPKKVKQLKNEIVKDRIAWNKKLAILQEYKDIIIQGLKNHRCVTEIYSLLLTRHIKVSYSTVARFVSQIECNKNQQHDLSPGQEAKVFFIPIGKFFYEKKSVQVWAFLMKLSYSNYCYCQVVTNCNFNTFLQCNKQAFIFFEAVPRQIKVCKTICFDLNTPSQKNRYTKFLGNYRSRLFSKNRTCYIRCQSEINFFKEEFLFHVLHKDYNKLSNDVGRWFAEVANLQINPFTKTVIEKEFVENELPAMIPLPKQKIK